MDTTPAPARVTSAGPVDPIDAHRPDPARRYDYWLGGKTNFAADRTSGDQIAEQFPTIRSAALENRRFLLRAITFLTERAGVRQFLDIGSGIPTSPNVHEVAQRIAPDSRVVYTDNSPVVISHARALMNSDPRGATAYLPADLRDPATILKDPLLTETLDLTRPVGLILAAVLHFLDTADQPYQVVAELLAALPPGSYLVLSHATYDPLPADVTARLTAAFTPTAGRHGTFRARTRAEVASFLTGLDLVDPGLAPAVQWRPHLQPHPEADATQTGLWAAVGRLR